MLEASFVVLFAKNVRQKRRKGIGWTFLPIPIIGMMNQ